MRKTWLIFSQAVTISLAVLFVIATLKPEWLGRRAASGMPTVVSILTAPESAANSASGALVTSSYSPAAKRATPAVVSIAASKAGTANPHAEDPGFNFFFENAVASRRRWASGRA